MVMEAVTVLHELNDQAAELNDLSAQLESVEDELESVQLSYDEFLGNYEAGLWQRHVDDGAKFPAEKLRERLARREMPPELLGSYIGLTNRRRRLVAQIGSVKKSIEAKRSILSALKEGLV